MHPDPPRPATVTVAPASVTLEALDATVQFSADVRDQHGQTMAGAAIVWTSTDASVATVDRAGVATAAGNGHAKIVATVGEAAGSGSLDVSQVANTVSVSPSTSTLVIGDTVRLEARALDANGHSVAGLVLWVSGSPSVASVDQTGVAVGVGEGTAEITATLGAAQGTAQIQVDDPVLPPMTDRDVLTVTYETTGGKEWSQDKNWVSTEPVGSWYGVTTDQQGRVTELKLRANGLSGPIPRELGALVGLRHLDLGGNVLSGSIPRELGSLFNLEQLYLDGNKLSGSIPTELGQLTNLQVLFIVGSGLSGSIPREMGGLMRLRYLALDHNELSGPIQTELGRLESLEHLSLSGNRLSGPIPRELGDLASLQDLYLQYNELSGPIPVELGSLASLQDLSLHYNELSGPLPRELGNLARLEHLRLGENQLSGALPREVGGLASLQSMGLRDNELEGAIPSEIKDMSSLTQLELAHNAGLAGELPAGIANLRLRSLVTSGTSLCVPRANPVFETWLRTMRKRRIDVCGTIGAEAYVIQAVQSRKHPVPLVAGEPALLRAFVTADIAGIQSVPSARVRFFLDGTEEQLYIPAKSGLIPTQVDEGSLQSSINGEVPGRLMQPGLEVVIDVDPYGRLASDAGVPKRIPDTGRLAVEVWEMPVLDLTVIPFLWRAAPDSVVLTATDGMAADPYGHELLAYTRNLLPVRELEVTAHEPVVSTSNGMRDLLSQVAAMRVLENGMGHWMGMISGTKSGPGGVAFQSGRLSASILHARVIAHELGHNMSMGHPPCGGAGLADLSFPYPGGVIGVWGYDLRVGRLVAPDHADVMSYCAGRGDWISDYHFTNALRWRLWDEANTAASRTGPTVSARSLLLWGGTDPDGDPFLNPAFVAAAPAALPDSAGDHTLTGWDAGGGVLFFLSFAMPRVADGDGSSAFAFVLPTRPEWAGALAGITLRGPGGTATLDSHTDQAMAILRNPRTGQIRGFLRDLPALTQADAAAAVSLDPGLELLFSRGIPDAEAW